MPPSNVIADRLSRYRTETAAAEEQALREILQHVVLFGLSIAGFFSGVAAFHGGTAVRIGHELPRFSEDLDFALLEADPTFAWRRFEAAIRDACEIRAPASRRRIRWDGRRLAHGSHFGLVNPVTWTCLTVSFYVVQGMHSGASVDTGMTRSGVCVALLGAALLGCGGAESTDDGGPHGSESIDGLPGEQVDGARAVLEIHLLDIWGQELVPETAVEIARDGQPVAAERLGALVRVSLSDAGRYSVRVTAADHHPLVLSAGYDGSGSQAGLSVEALEPTPGGAHGITVGHAMVEGAVPLHRLLLGVRHKWFSAQARPARRGNRVELYRDGQSAWSSVRAELEGAGDSVMVSTWWWESNFEVTRPLATHHELTPSQRRHNTIMGVLEKIPAHKRVLVGQFLSQDGFFSNMTVDDELLAKAQLANDKFEYMGQANPTSGQFFFEPAPFVFGQRVHPDLLHALSLDPEPAIASNVPGRPIDLTQWPIELDVPAASWHQKFMVVDSEVAFVGGMNLRRVDWDTEEHRVFEHRRMLFDATTADRVKVMNKEKLPDTGPRKDYLTRIEGPAAQDVADVFAARWQHQIDNGAEYADRSTSTPVERDIAPRPDGLQVQITTTMPKPFWEHGIAESWLNAVDNAEHYIYVEDQYWRAPMLVERIVARMKQVPGLRLVVVTKPVNEWADPGCAWTYLTDAELRSQFPGRYLTLQLRAFDYVETWGFDETESRFADMDIHSKMLIVDDVFLSVGSANKNNRGMVYEGEMNVAVLDATWVRAQRSAILAGILPKGTTPSDDATGWFSQLKNAAGHNDDVHAAWDAEGGDIDLDGAPLPSQYAPRGFVYSLDFGQLSDCLFESVGPDQTEK